MADTRSSTSTRSRSKTRLKKPGMYKVLMFNDDITTMDFVVEILRTIFDKTGPMAEKIMLDIHNNGKGVCGIYTYEIAETKVFEVQYRAEQAKFPLRCTLEKE